MSTFHQSCLNIKTEIKLQNPVTLSVGLTKTTNGGSLAGNDHLSQAIASPKFNNNNLKKKKKKKLKWYI